MKWVLAVCISALIGSLGLAQAYARIDIDHAICFRGLAGFEEGEAFAVQVAFPWFAAALASFHFIPYLLGTLTVRRREALVWGIGSVVLTLASLSIFLTDPSRQHDCDRKGLEFDAIVFVLAYPLLFNLVTILMCLFACWAIRKRADHAPPSTSD